VDHKPDELIGVSVCVKVIFDPQSPGGTIDRASSITPGTSSDEASTLDGAIAGL